VSRIGLLIGLMGLLALAWMGSQFTGEDKDPAVMAKPWDTVYVVTVDTQPLVFVEYDYALEYARGDASKVKTVTVLRRPD
jgi:hypothetical protein